MNSSDKSIERSGENLDSLIDDLEAKHVAIAAWIVTAGCYGYAAALWGSTSVDMQSASPYPEYAWLFLVTGLGIGVGMSASMVASLGDDDE